MFMLLTIALGTWWNVEDGLFKCPGFLFKYSRTGVQIPPDYCSNVSGLVFKFRRKNVQMFPDTCSSSTGFLFKYFGFLVQMRPDYARQLRVCLAHELGHLFIIELLNEKKPRDWNHLIKRL
jgi:hypothetical protein